jgi:hypothetical protein
MTALSLHDEACLEGGTSRLPFPVYCGVQRDLLEQLLSHAMDFERRRDKQAAQLSAHFERALMENQKMRAESKERAERQR